MPYNKPPCMYCKSNEHSSYDSAMLRFECSDKLDIEVELNEFLMKFRIPDVEEVNADQPA